MGAARNLLEPYVPGDLEDVAIEALEEVIENVGGLKSVDEAIRRPGHALLRPFVWPAF